MFRPGQIAIVLLPLILAACKHPLEIDGQGDIVERNLGVRGCSVDEFNAQLTRCSDNEVTETAAVRYQALPRSGWRFSHWEGCSDPEATDSCEFDYLADWAAFWDETLPDTAAPSLKAVFQEDKDAAEGVAYIASNFGIADGAFSALLDAQFLNDSSYRYTTQQAGTRAYFDRQPKQWERQSSGLLISVADEDTRVGGAATSEMDLITLVDTDTADIDSSVSYLTPKLERANNALLEGVYYCGQIGTRGLARFSRMILDGDGGGLFQLVEDRFGAGGQTGIGYTVFEDGTATLDYSSVHLVGSVSADGGLFVASQLQNDNQGAAICIRSSSNHTLGTMQGSYIGAWASTQPAMGVTELLVDITGTTAEAVYIDSYGGRDYSLGTDIMLVNWDGKLETRLSDGAVSADGRIAFLVNTDPTKFPTLIVYVRKT